MRFFTLKAVGQYKNSLFFRYSRDWKAFTTKETGMSFHCRSLVREHNDNNENNGSNLKCTMFKNEVKDQLTIEVGTFHLPKLSVDNETASCML